MAVLLLVLVCLAGCDEPVMRGVMPLGEPGPNAAAPGRTLPALMPGDLPADGVLKLGYAPVATELQQESWVPLRDHMLRRLGVRIEPVPFDSYGELVEAVTAGEVELALLAPLSYVLAREAEPGVEPLVQTLSEGKTSYSAYLFVARSAPYQRIEDLRGARLAFVDQRSTSGFLLPYAQLLDAGVDPERDLGSIVFTGDHVGALRLLATGEVDAAASYADALSWATQRAAKEGWEMPAMRLLGNTGRIPLDMLCAAPGVSGPLREALREELLRTNTTMGPGRAFFSASGRIVGWTDTSDEQYDGVRELWQRVRAHRGGM